MFPKKMNVYRRKFVPLHRDYSNNNGKRETKKPKPIAF